MSPYRCTTGLVGLAELANAEKPVPRERIKERGNFVTEALIRYASPLTQSEVEVPIENGLPKYLMPKRKPVPKNARRGRLGHLRPIEEKAAKGRKHK